MQKFKWTSTQSAPTEFPIQLINADLLLEDDSTYYIPDDRSVYNGWGQLGATHIVGDDDKALPVKLAATWFSYIEGKFFRGEFDLPKDALQAFFNAGLESPRRGEHRNFDKIVFGFGPEGEGAVWVSGFGTTVQVMRFTAPEIDLEWTSVLDNPDVSKDVFIEMVLFEALGNRREAIKQLLPLDGYWRQRQQKFKYSLSVLGAAEVTLLRLETLNGERLHFDEEQPLVPRTKLGFPRMLTIEWTGQKGEKRLAEIILDEDEVLTSFERLAQDTNSMNLIVQISEASNAVAILLQNEELEFEFSNDGAKVFSRE